MVPELVEGSQGVERSKGERIINSKARSPYPSIGNYIPLSPPLLTFWWTDSRPALSRCGRPRSSRSKTGSAKASGPHLLRCGASTISGLLLRNADAEKVRMIMLMTDGFFGMDLSSSKAPCRRKGFFMLIHHIASAVLGCYKTAPPPHIIERLALRVLFAGMTALLLLAAPMDEVRAQSAPRVTKVSVGGYTLSLATFGLDAVFELRVEFDQSVNVTGRPHLVVEVGSQQRKLDLYAGYGVPGAAANQSPTRSLSLTNTTWRRPRSARSWPRVST